MRYWIATVSKEHVLRGVAGGFCQACHGKAAPLKRMSKNDWLLYYSPTLRMDDGGKYQAFTAVGQITDDAPYPFQMTADFIPYRRNVNYAAILRECPLATARSHPEWKSHARQLRYGHFETSEDFFHYIKSHMCSEDIHKPRQNNLFFPS